MGQKFVNNLVLALSSDITSSTVAIPVVSSLALPVLGVGDFIYLTIYDIREGGELRWEIVKVNNYSSNTLQVVRAQNGTLAQNWSSGAQLGNRVIALDMQSLIDFKDSKNALNGLAPLVNGTVPVSNLPSYVNSAVQTQLNTKVSNTITSVNASHTIQNPDWIANFDGTVTGALQIKITGLYTQTLSGGMEILLTQNNVVSGVYPDYVFYIGGNWRGNDQSWYNTEARVDTVSLNSLNVRFAHNGSDAFIVVGEPNTVWNFPRLVIRDMITNNVAAGYIPGIEVSLVTVLPTHIDSTILVSGLGTYANFYDAFNTSTT
jgi:hypothetical protein